MRAGEKVPAHVRRSSFGKPSTARDLGGAQAQVASRSPGTMASPEGSEPGPGDGRGGKVVKSLHLRRGKRRTKEDARAPECSYGRGIPGCWAVEAGLRG